MVDTREVFAGLYAGGRQPPWKAQLDELLPDPARRSRDADSDFYDSDYAAAHHPAHVGSSSSSSSTSTGMSAPSPPAPAAAASNSSTSSSTTKRKQLPSPASRTRPDLKKGGGADVGEEQATGPFYDEGADLKDELWVTEKYLRHHHHPPKTTTSEGAEEEEARAKKKKKTPAAAARPDDWTSDRNDPLTRPRRSDAVLSCPCCFTPLCYDCQRHDVYLSQYRAMFVTDECTARLTESRTYEGDQYHPVYCAICETEVGVLEPADELYHFFNVIPGN